MAMRRAASRMSATDRDRHLGEHFGFGDVGRDHAREPEQRPSHRVHGLFVEQVIAALGDHDRIDDQVRQLERFDRRRDGFDDRRVGQHARSSPHRSRDPTTTASICAVTKSSGTTWTPVTPTVFCAVSAVMAEVP